MGRHQRRNTYLDSKNSRTKVGDCFAENSTNSVCFSVSLSVKLPPPRIREKFLIIYELEGCQKAVNYLSKYYSVRRMKIFYNGRKVGKWCLGLYLKNCAYFKKEGLTKKIILHEFYHHLIETSGIEISIAVEERQANNFSKKFLARQNHIKQKIAR
jgi:hypothetical protein